MAKSYTLKLNNQVKPQVHDAAARGLMLGAEHVLQVARDQAPIEEGTLERSGVASLDERDLRAAVSFDTPYAVRQHEELDYRHDAGRQAKYLEDALNGERDVVARIVQREIRKVT